ncbi:acyl-CoA dehydrogenase [Echria macrotheca]|uniref:Acyl-CoA dehydrogenase n=1 Tax=Echria macrotheca TaxID=438768 RepID=A0AAJ0BGM4_9PEZI|nr:acyl-CoA dehydrogenase [Echria macrotheca]
MHSEEFPVEVILDAIDAMASSQGSKRPPKVILFDIGGVCVISPFQSILDYELQLGIPPGWINYSISKTAPSGFWHRLETGLIPMDSAFFAGFNRDLHDPVRWEAFYRAQQARNPSLPEKVPPVPEVDGEWLFFDMMASARAPDPWMFPALKRLRESGRFIVAALSNTVIFPPDHEYSRVDFFDDPVRSLFDVFVSSAHVGLRKPDPKIYELALQKVDEFARTNANSERGKAGGWANGVKPEDIVFLDDIGENLKAARKAGFRTIKVPLGRAFEAVDELEKVTGLKLAGDHPRIPIKPNFKAKAKI